MKLLLMSIGVFFLTLFVLERKEYQKIKGYKSWTRGFVEDIVLKDNQYHLKIQYKNPFMEEECLYWNPLKNKKINQNQEALLRSKYINQPYFLMLKTENQKIQDVKPYNNAFINQWVYLVLSCILIGISLIMKS
jgi:hypothetical protein